MVADARGIHMGDIDQLGSVVVGAFEHPETVGEGQYLSVGGDLLSWDDVIATLREQGHNIAFEQTDEDPYWMRDMFAYFEAYTCFGPNSDDNIARAEAISVEPLTDFATWAAANMPVQE